MPRISVIIPTYNRAHHLKAAVSSVLNQTYTDLELIIVDDGSTDATREVGEQFCHLDNRVRYLYQNNGGPSAARNMGIRAARGDFIAFLDSDDYWMPIKLAEQLAIAEQDARIGVVYCNWEWVLEGGLVSPGVSPPDPSLATMYEAFFIITWWMNPHRLHWSVPSALIRLGSSTSPCDMRRIGTCGYASPSITNLPKHPPSSCACCSTAPNQVLIAQAWQPRTWRS